MLAKSIIARKRDDGALSRAEIDTVVAGLVDGDFADAQIAALAMAIYLNGMTREECRDLTLAMTASGSRLDWRGITLPGPLVDKHSTGGVGDKVSLMLAPMVAACGAAVPMISGRGLGHTGGTLDKLAAIPGYNATPDTDRIRQVVGEVGCAIVGQTAELAPADRRFYAVRDVTATVESVALITASILSKKMAAGLDALVMDVKCGSGAFAATPEMAHELAQSIVDVAGDALPTRALITDMDAVLGRTAGNALEVGEAVAYLTGEPRNARLDELVVALAAEMLMLAGLASDAAGGRVMAATARDSGQAAEVFARMVAALGGPADFIERADDYLATAPVVLDCAPAAPGVVTGMDARAIGLAIVALGGGRRQVDDAVDPAVGLTDIAGHGETVGPTRPLARVHARSIAEAEAAIGAIQAAYKIADAPVSVGPVVLDRVG